MTNVKKKDEVIDSILKLKDLGRDVKVDLRISCKIGLFLAMALEQGLHPEGPSDLIKLLMSDDDRRQLDELISVILKKSESEQFYELLKKIVEV